MRRGGLELADGFGWPALWRPMKPISGTCRRRSARTKTTRRVVNLRRVVALARPANARSSLLSNVITQAAASAHSTLPRAAWSDRGGHRAREYRSRERIYMTDESKLYHQVGQEFAAHHTVNTFAWRVCARRSLIRIRLKAISRFSNEVMRGVYQHCAEKNLASVSRLSLISATTPAKSVDGERVVLAVKGGEGKRLTYRQPH